MPADPIGDENWAVEGLGPTLAAPGLMEGLLGDGMVVVVDIFSRYLLSSFSVSRAMCVCVCVRCGGTGISASSPYLTGP